MEHNAAKGNSTPITVLDYATCIQMIGSGQFTSRFTEENRIFLASLYGAPFFAISQLAPETLQAPSSSVIFGGTVSPYALDGGRWLSLYAKGLKSNAKISCAVCVSSKPPPIGAPKPLLFQPPQSILIKPWSKHLRDSGTVPDVLVLFAPHSFNEHVSTIDDLSAYTHRCKTLMSFQSRAEAIIIQKLLMARGFDVSDILSYEVTHDQPQHFAAGAWWLRVSVESPDRLIAPSDDFIDNLRRCYGTYEGFINRSGSHTAAAAIAAIYGARTNLEVGGRDVPNAVLIEPGFGIDLHSGRMFSEVKNDNTEANVIKWDGRTLDRDLLDLAPNYKPELSIEENRFLLMSWLSHVLTEKERRSEDTRDQSTYVHIKTEDLAPSSTDKEHVDVAYDSSATKNSSRSIRLQSTKPRSQRSRISRAAGTVNVLALAAQLGKVGASNEGAFEITRSLLINWLKRKGFGDLDPTVNVHVEMPYGEVSVETDGTSVWSMRFDDRRKMDSGAFWRVEVSLIGMPKPAIGLRLFHIRQTEDAPAPLSGVPTVISQIASDVGMQDAGIDLLSEPITLVRNNGATRLIELLCTPNRTQSVIVVSATDGVQNDTSIRRLATRLAGVAHVVCIDRRVSGEMARTLGRQRSVFGNAIRLYRPGFAAASDPFMDRIWSYNGRQIPIAMANDIAEEACAISVEVGDIDERAPSFIKIRNLLSDSRLDALRKRTASVASSAEEERKRQQAIRQELESALSKYKDQNEDLNKQLSFLLSELQTTRRERDAALDEARQLKNWAENRWTQDETQHCYVDDDSYYPDNWDEIEEWVEIYGDGELVLLPQAAKAAKESPFKDIQLAYKAMELLARYYVPMKTRDNDDDEARTKYEDALNALGLELSAVGTALKDKRYKKEYKRLYDGREITLNMHLKKGVGFDPSTVFRLYFYYDEANEKVIIGHLTTHLTNRLTHSA